MQQNLELLKEISFFNDFPAQARKLIAFLAQRSHMEAGETIFEKGDDFGQAHLVLTGSLALYAVNNDQGQPIRKFYPGDFLGSLSLLGPLPSLFELRSETDCSLLTLNREHFAKILEQFPQSGKLFLKAALNELHQWERKNITEAKSCCQQRLGATVL